MPRYEYRVVNGFTGLPDRDEALINELVADGWEPVGFATISFNDYGGLSEPEADIVGYFRRPVEDATNEAKTAET